MTDLASDVAVTVRVQNSGKEPIFIYCSTPDG